MSDAQIDRELARQAYDRASEALTRQRAHEEYCERREGRDEKFKSDIRNDIAQGFDALHSRINKILYSTLAAAVAVVAYLFAKILGWTS